MMDMDALYKSSLSSEEAKLVERQVLEAVDDDQQGLGLCGVAQAGRQHADELGERQAARVHAAPVDAGDLADQGREQRARRVQLVPTVHTALHIAHLCTEGNSSTHR